MRRVVDTYGNHPSFVFFALGNELGRSVWSVTGRWIEAEKRYDPRHLYAAATAREITPWDDFADTHLLPGVGRVRDRVEPHNDWDYEEQYAAAPVPTFAHELGQWPTYPAWSEIQKYTGVLRAANLERCHRRAIEQGVADRDLEFRAASGALAVRLYKDQMESHLRTPSCQGFSTLSLQDYPGQGEALVGWLDAFFDPKGIVTPERFRRWCSAVVPLVRTPSYLIVAGEPIEVTAQVANYGPVDLVGATAVWRLTASADQVLANGTLPAQDVPTGEVTTLGRFTIDTGGLEVPAQVRLELRVTGADVSCVNDWDLWVYPDRAPVPAPAGVVVCDRPETARAALARGERVLLLAHDLGGKRNSRLASFKPVYWSAVYFPGAETLGGLVHDDHPALAGFPPGQVMTGSGSICATVGVALISASCLRTFARSCSRCRTSTATAGSAHSSSCGPRPAAGCSSVATTSSPTSTSARPRVNSAPVCSSTSPDRASLRSTR